METYEYEDNTLAPEINAVRESDTGFTVQGEGNNHYFVVDPDMSGYEFECFYWTLDARVDELESNGRLTVDQYLLCVDYLSSLCNDYKNAHSTEYSFFTDETRAAYRTRFVARANAFLAILEFAEWTDD